MSRRTTSFGVMWEHDYGRLLESGFEVMHFEKQGKPHAHGGKELAVCVSGSGLVYVDGNPIKVKAGEVVAIPARSQHYMDPDLSFGMTMVILYEAP